MAVKKGYKREETEGQKAKGEDRSEAQKRQDKNKVGVHNHKGQKASRSGPQSEEERAKHSNTARSNAAVRRLVEAESLDYLREALLTPNAAGNPFYQEYINTFLKRAIDDPESICSRMLGSGLFSERTLSKLDKEASSLINKDRDFAVYRIRSTLFDKQQQVFDNDIDKTILVICSRRSGKTELNARKILKVALKNNSPILYLNKTFENAIRQLFDVIINLTEQFNLGISRSSKSEGFIEFTNGSSIKFGGVNDIAKIDTYRGYKYRLVVVDEIAHLKNQKILIDEVLKPATADFSDSQMIFTGTPPRTKNYVHELWEQPYIKKYTWTFLDNPFIPNSRAFLEEVLKEKNLDEKDPYIQREYFGNLYAFDVEALVYGKRQYFEEIPNSIDKVYIGVDFGFQDFNGLVAVFVDTIDKKAYVGLEEKFNHAGFKEIAVKINKMYLDALDIFKQKRRDNLINLTDNITIITDTNEPALAFDLQTEYKLPVEKAYKYDKAGSIAQLSDMLREGKIKIKKSGFCDNECEVVVYKRDEKDNIIMEIDDEQYHPDIMDALRYVSRHLIVDFQIVDDRVGSLEEIDTTKPIELQRQYNNDSFSLFND